MVLTLSELLERIRPTGTPGAPTEGEQQRRSEDRAAELVLVTAVLAKFEAEADEVVAIAELEAGTRLERARQEVRRIEATLPDRVASAGAEITAIGDRRRDAEKVAIHTDAAEEVERLMNRADSAIPSLVEAAVEIIWDAISAPPEQPS